MHGAAGGSSGLGGLAARTGNEEEAVSHRPRTGWTGAAWLAVAAVAAAGCGGAPSTSPETSLPTFASVDAVRSHASEAGVPILLDFYTDW